MNFTIFAGYLSEWLGVLAVIIILDRLGKMSRRPVNFQYPQREKGAVAVVYLLSLITSFFTCRIPTSYDILPGIELTQALEKEALMAVICLFPVSLALLYRKQPLLSAGWGRRQALNLALRVGLTLIFLSMFLRGKVFSITNGVTAAEGLSLLALAVICVAEETIFRGYIQLRMNSLLGERYGWWSTALLFLIWRIPLLLLNPAEFWIHLGICAIQSILLGWIMWKCNHVLASALYRTISEWLTII